MEGVFPECTASDRLRPEEDVFQKNDGETGAEILVQDYKLLSAETTLRVRNEARQQSSSENFHSTASLLYASLFCILEKMLTLKSRFQAELAKYQLRGCF